jgi:formate dehydrogenase major subunit
MNMDTDERSDENTEKEGVAGFMQRAKQQAKNGVNTAAQSDAFEHVEHAVESAAARTMSEGQLFDVADALSDHQLDKIDVTDTTCGYCAVGCRFDLYTKDGEVRGVRPNPEKAPINGISTCVKGKFSYDYVTSDDRLTQPLIKDGENGEFREASWDEALDRVVEGLQGIQDEYGTDALSMVASSKATNEDNYVMQKFARQVLGTNNIDNCNRLCHAATVSGLAGTVGYGTASVGMEAIEETDCYVIIGSNTTEAHPVIATRIKQNVKEGADLMVFDPRKVQIAEYADQYTRVEPGYDTTWINGVIRYIIENDLHDEEFIEERTTGFSDIKESVQEFTPEFVEEKAGVPPEELAYTAETIANADSCVFGWTLGLVEQSHGTENAYAISNLALITGHIGSPKSGLSPFRGQNNVQGGGGDMGPLPNNFPGYQPVTNEDNQEKFADAWGMDVEDMPAEEGRRLTDMFLAADEGDIRGMFIQGENPTVSEPNIGHAQNVLEELEFLAVQDIFLSETAEYADVVLPATSCVESNGTFTSSTRHVQLVKRAIERKGSMKPDWRITQELAERFGYEWGYETPSDIMHEISELTPIYGGITHERLEREGSIQWPCWDEDHPGTPYMYEEEFQTDDGKAHMNVATTVDPAELPDEDYPLVLTTGRVLYQYHTGTMTFREEGIMSYSGESFIEVHPDTAAEYGISDSEYVEVTSRHGATEVLVQVTNRPSPGKVFIPMHYLKGGANNLTKAEPLDEPSRAPEFKVTDVQITVERPVKSEPTPAEIKSEAEDTDESSQPAVSDD